MAVSELVSNIGAENPRIAEAPATEDQTLRKVKSVALQALFWVGWAIAAALAVATVIPAGVVIVQKARSHYNLKQTIQALAENRYRAVRDAMNQEHIIKLENMRLCDLGSKDINRLKGTNQEKSKLLYQVIRLIEMVKNPEPENSGLHDHMQEFRALLNEAVSSKIYQENKNEKTNYYIVVLQAAAHALVSESPGMKPMQDYGAKTVGDVSGQMTYERLANVLEDAVEEQTVFKKNGIIGKIFWTFTHPQKFLESSLDQFGYTDPLSYNSYEHGNASVKVGKFDVQKSGWLGSSRASYALTLAPTFVADRLTEADRDYGAKRLVQDLEAGYTNHEGEKGRVAAKARLANDDLRVLNTSINLKKGKEPEIQFESHLSEYLETAFGDNLQAKRLAEVSIRALEEMLAQPFGEGEFYFSQSCKQNIDRGVVVNAATILLADAIWEPVPLTEERIHQIVGMVLVRAGMVDDRAILKKWFRSLTDLLNVMQEKPDLTLALQAHFSGKGRVRFVASDR